MDLVIRKVFIDYEKEEEFLNDMSLKGWALKRYTWCKYTFEEAPKGKYIYRLELLDNLMSHPDSQKYIQFMEETGAEFVTSYIRWAYFRKDALDGEFTIYSDIDSKLNHYKKIFSFFLILTGINVLIGAMNMYHGFKAVISGRPPVNTFACLISFITVAFMVGFAVLPMYKKIEKLKKEKEVIQ